MARDLAIDLGTATLTFTGWRGDGEGGTLIIDGRHEADASAHGTLPGDADFRFGAYSFELNVLEGSTVDVVIETPSPATTLFKSIDGEWAEYPATFDGTSIAFTLTDGGSGDADGAANGVIVDPVAAAVSATFTG